MKYITPTAISLVFSWAFVTLDIFNRGISYAGLAYYVDASVAGLIISMVLIDIRRRKGYELRGYRALKVISILLIAIICLPFIAYILGPYGREPLFRALVPSLVFTAIVLTGLSGVKTKIE